VYARRQAVDGRAEPYTLPDDIGRNLVSLTETSRSSDGRAVVATSEPPRLHPITRFRELVASRELLVNLIRKEVKLKYVSSMLGALWSMLNPVLYLVVFSLVFKVVLKNRTPSFPVYLLSGLLAWNLFSTSLSSAVRSVVDNASLVKRVYLPREVLPLSSVGSAMVDFVLQAIVLLAFMLVFRYNFFGLNLVLLPLALVTLIVLASALAMFVSALNVRYRDTQHLLTLGLTLWLWLTPVIYPSAFVFDRLAGKSFLGIPLLDLFLANPMAPIILAFQRALYAHPTPVAVVGDARTPVHVLPDVSIGFLAVALAGVAVGSLVLLLLAWRTYFHRSGDFAEDL
jgi:ABC-2 type transport system permease protein